MINARGHAAAVAREGFARQITPAAYFAKTLREAAARQAETHVRVRPERVRDAQFGIEIHRRDRHAQREIRLHEARLVVIKKRVARRRAAALDVFVVAQLQQAPRLRIDLGAGRGREREQEQKNREATEGSAGDHRS